jgi:hypothetical protein
MAEVAFFRSAGPKTCQESIRQEILRISSLLFVGHFPAIHCGGSIRIASSFPWFWVDHCREFGRALLSRLIPVAERIAERMTWKNVGIHLGSPPSDVI